MTTRVLLCITVYGGRGFVESALQSAARLNPGTAELDVLVLDDCSPEPGWSEDVSGLCAELGLRYYRSPRNLGIPRNVNLGLLTALSEGYDHVVICNSDVLFPRNLIPHLLSVAAQPGVGSVTAWSNNVSIYSLPNADAARNLDDQDVVDWLAESVAGHWGDAAMDVPAGISFCILIPVPVLREVGLMDPVFGRGYCEETDWTLRSLKLGYRIALAPGTFVYHAGRGSTQVAGVLAAGETTVSKNEALIDLRYPQFRRQVRAYVGSGIIDAAHEDAVRTILTDAGRQFGYTVEVGWVPRRTADDRTVRCIVAPEGRSHIKIMFRGFALAVDAPAEGVGAYLARLFGRDPEALRLYDRGRTSAGLRESSTAPVHDHHLYPTKV